MPSTSKESFEDELLECEFLEREEQCGALTLRSGKHLEDIIQKKPVQTTPKPIGQARAEEKELNEEVPNPPTEKAKGSKERKEELKPYSPPVPFPQRLLKRTIEEDDPHLLNHECSALFSKQMPQKVRDPGKFTIQCSIGDMSFSSPLADLGASVSVMPLAIYHKLKLNGVKTAKMTLQLADGTTRRPWGLVENVPIKVDKFYIPCDFVVVDMGDNFTSSLILGRPFLATAGFKVDVGKGKLTLKIGGEKVKIEKPKGEQVASIEKKLEKEEAEVIKGEKVNMKEWHKMFEPDEDPPVINVNHHPTMI
ncbi:unnamed protein product [Rhodiola kirilowii]